MKAGAGWPLALGAVLAVTVVANIALLWKANAPGSDDIEPDYYRRALAWDSTQSARSRSATLGWRCEAVFTRAAAGTGTALELALADSLGHALAGAAVAVVGVHNLDPLHLQAWNLPESSPGHYDAVVRLPHDGRWELRVAASRGPDHYLAVLHAESPPLAKP